MVLGDIFDIASRVKEYDPSYELYWNPHICKYQVLAKKQTLREEGVYHGHPLFSLSDYDEVVFTWEGTPDMRIIWALHESDVWNYPGGPAKYYDDMMAESEKKKQKRDQELSDTAQYVANEYQPYVFEEKKSFLIDKVV
jgi:hypothetical protein